MFEKLRKRFEDIASSIAGENQQREPQQPWIHTYQTPTEIIKYELRCTATQPDRIHFINIHTPTNGPAESVTRRLELRTSPTPNTKRPEIQLHIEQTVALPTLNVARVEQPRLTMTLLYQVAQRPYTRAAPMTPVANQEVSITVVPPGCNYTVAYDPSVTEQVAVPVHQSTLVQPQQFNFAIQTNNTQFSITTQPAPTLENQYKPILRTKLSGSNPMIAVVVNGTECLRFIGETTLEEVLHVPTMLR